MITYELQLTSKEVPVSVTCDRCKKKFDDEFDLQEFHHIRFAGGYTSVFGDMSQIECDICQDCLKELIGDFCRYVD